MQTDFEQLWQTHQAAISRVVCSYEANPHLQEELLQEIGLACWHALPSCNDKSAVKAFLLRIAHNKSVDHVSRQVRQPKTDSLNHSGNALEASPHVTIVASPAAIHSSTINIDRQREQLLAAMRQLPLAQKQTVGLLFEGFSYQEIADITGLTTSNVGVMINRAKEKLKGIINATR